MLNQYLAQTQQLLQNPGATNALYPTSNLTDWINTARGQVAAEAQCIRATGGMVTVSGTNSYPFDLVFATTATGVSYPLNIWGAWIVKGSGKTWMWPRPWPWFSVYELNNAAPKPGTPTTWSVFAQGSPGSSSFVGVTAGSFYVSPTPDNAYTLVLDCSWIPIALVDDTTVEAIPYIWTDAVPYFAAYLALLSSQTSARAAEADKMFQRYKMFVERARAASNPDILKPIYQGAVNQTRQNQLAVGGGAGGGG